MYDFQEDLCVHPSTPASVASGHAHESWAASKSRHFALMPPISVTRCDLNLLGDGDSPPALGDVTDKRSFMTRQETAVTGHGPNPCHWAHGSRMLKAEPDWRALRVSHCCCAPMQDAQAGDNVGWSDVQARTSNADALRYGTLMHVGALWKGMLTRSSKWR